MRILNAILRATLVAIILSFLQSLPASADIPHIDFRPEATRTAGPVADGSLLGRGRVTWNGPHEGFRLWLEGGQDAGDYRLALTSPGGTGLPLRVRIETDEPATAEDAGRGLRILSSQNSVNFRIVTDGHQEASPGMWRLLIGASTVLSL
ncbi:hypothetical protein ELK40_00560 (plasmid) [Enterobacter sp. N18-03635]|uniref:AfaD family invasin n=1 Tax=Enterobacter sp. N18-03635 TaxID=2500132 RepID=UPI000FD81F4A|nr:AfaD family invasin [Enterobacter sp. N18-03635]AZV03699.1 hypothetical protein ELK40_00560 [Enterobacter sp. N18-03635]